MILLLRQIGRTLSVKCSNKTLGNLKILFKEDLRFIKLGNYGVVLNPSWFFKFSACYTIKNLAIENNINEFAYNCHYVDFVDSTLKNNILYSRDSFVN